MVPSHEIPTKTPPNNLKIGFIKNNEITNLMKYIIPNQYQFSIIR